MVHLLVIIVFLSHAGIPGLKTGVAAISCTDFLGPAIISKVQQWLQIPTGFTDATGTGVNQVSFFLQLVASGTGADMAAFGYTLSTTDKMTTYTADDVSYTWVKTVDGSGHSEHGGFLEPREMVLVTIPTGFTPADMGLSDKFMVEVKPAIGAPVTITGTVPGAMSAKTWYDVY